MSIDSKPSYSRRPSPGLFVIRSSLLTYSSMPRPMTTPTSTSAGPPWITVATVAPADGDELGTSPDGAANVIR